MDDSTDRIEIAQELFDEVFSAMKTRGINNSAGHKHRFVWDLFELQALLAGCSPSLAALGREVMMRSHVENWGEADVGPNMMQEMLDLAALTPDAAMKRWSWLLIASSGVGLAN